MNVKRSAWTAIALFALLAACAPAPGPVPPPDPSGDAAIPWRPETLATVSARPFNDVNAAFQEAVRAAEEAFPGSTGEFEVFSVSVDERLYPYAYLTVNREPVTMTWRWDSSWVIETRQETGKGTPLRPVRRTFSTADVTMPLSQAVAAAIANGAAAGLTFTPISITVSMPYGSSPVYADGATNTLPLIAVDAKDQYERSLTAEFRADGVAPDGAWLDPGDIEAVLEDIAATANQIGAEGELFISWAQGSRPEIRAEVTRTPTDPVPFGPGYSFHGADSHGEFRFSRLVGQFPRDHGGDGSGVRRQAMAPLSCTDTAAIQTRIPPHPRNATWTLDAERKSYTAQVGADGAEFNVSTCGATRTILRRRIFD